MNRTRWKFGIGILWLGLPLIAFRYWMVWDSLPVRLATHFNAAGQPNGWMTREGSMYFILGLYLFLSVLFTVILTVIHKVHAPDAAAGAMLGLFYVVCGVLYYGNESVLAYNLTGAPVQILPIVAPVMIAICVVVMLSVVDKRGESLPEAATVAEENHAGRIWALVLILPAIVNLVFLYVVPGVGLRLLFSIPAVILLLAAAMAWSGFTYRFTAAGVEVRTLGLRVRSIPAEQIKQYAADKWSMAGGYGIRGLGACRAYVWSNRGVRIKTSDGEVFLGHSNPDRIVHDLDAVKQHV